MGSRPGDSETRPTDLRPRVGVHLCSHPTAHRVATRDKAITVSFPGDLDLSGHLDPLQAPNFEGCVENIIPSRKTKARVAAS
jgi:hypothetical protein